MLVSLVAALSLIFATGVSANAAPAPASMAPTVAVGSDFLEPILGYYIDLNRTDQGAVTSGAAAGVAAVICIQTDGVLCPAAAALLGAVSFYIAVNGYCPDVLRVYPRYYVMRCA
ncbi:hypothetical protein NicSoilC5_03360 [Arthrobacter sp. NicSoilC5]|nr:hypothetical protein NicSoilC5_03360 [Arthrobacter sp. NicSoilC5]